MYAEPGPSRYSQPPPDQKYPSRDGAPGTRGPPRREGGYEREDRSNGFGRQDNGPRAHPTSGWRPNPRFESVRPPRTRTPSPPRPDFDRGWSRPRDGPDPRDRPNMGPRPGGPPDRRGREPWNDRRPPADRRDERYDSRSNPSSRGSPTRNPGFYPDRQHSPPRGPKGAPNGPYPNGPRIPSGPYGDRDRPYDRVGFPGRDGERSREVSSQSAPRPSPPEKPPIAPRSMRGSSSPVEAKHHRSNEHAPLSTPSATIPLPRIDGADREDGELEEGEVLSPVRPSAPFRRLSNDRPGDSFRPRTNFSPQKRDRPIWNERRTSPVKREPEGSPQPWMNRESVDEGWATRSRRSSAQNSPDKERPSPINTSPPSVPSSDRPPTPPLPSAGGSPILIKAEESHLAVKAPVHSIEPKDVSAVENTEGEMIMAVAEQASSDDQSQDRLQEEPTAGPETAADVHEDEKESLVTIIEAAQEVASAVSVTLPDIQTSSSTEAPGINVQDAAVDVMIESARKAPTASINDAPKSAVTQDPPLGGADISKLAPPDRASTPSDNLRPRTLRNPSPLPRQTLAERRAVVLPPTNGPLSSPFVAKSSRDNGAAPFSVPGSTDSEYAPPYPRRNNRSDAPFTEGEELRANRLVSSIKHAQLSKVELDTEAILQVNISTSPTESSRLKAAMDNKLRNKQLRDTTWPLHKTSGDTAKRLARALAKQAGEDQERLDLLKEEYLELDEEWRQHCKFLDEQMAKRGPPPPELYAFPAILPVITPGPAPVPTTPIAEDLLSARMNRRRGGAGGDAVATEADFEAILAQLADDAAKDPDQRARKTTATVPDMLLPWERSLRYDDENDLVTDPLTFYDYSGTKEPIWTDEERAIFLRRYLNFPKQFGKIAEALPDKNASDCVLYYYRTKKEVDYKAMLASRRGVTKKKALPIKKGGKSSALLSDLARSKPTAMKPSMKPASARSMTDATTIARKAKEMSVKRRTGADADEGGVEVHTPSRPDVAGLGKAKMRVSVKTKRPRVSSLPETPGGSVAPTPSQTPSQAQNDLLPPLKRPRKNRKVELAEMNGVAPDGTPGGLSGDKAPRRGNTSSYWSVEEKKRVRELFTVHGRNVQAIAAEMPGKTERQISNFVESHVVATAGAEGQEGYAKPNGLATMAYDRMYPPQHPGGVHGYPSEPRLGVFPSTPAMPSGPGEAKPSPADSPIKHVSRPGGMRISALLNDEIAHESAETRRDSGNDAASDGTVDDQDNSRPSPNTAPISMNTIYDNNRRYSGASGDRPVGGYRAQDGRPPGYGGFWASRPPTYPQAPPSHPPAPYHHQHPHQRSMTGPPPSTWDRNEPPPPAVHHNVGQPSMGYFRPDYRERLAPPGMQQSNERYSPAPNHSSLPPHSRAESAPDRVPSRESVPSPANSLPPLKSASSPHPPNSSGSTPAPTTVPSPAPVTATAAQSDKPSTQPWML